jgi:hypothetical protein
MEILRWIAEWGLPIAEALLGVIEARRMLHGITAEAADITWLQQMLVTLIKNNEKILLDIINRGESALADSVIAMVSKSRPLIAGILKQYRDTIVAMDDVATKEWLDKLIVTLSK